MSWPPAAGRPCQSDARTGACWIIQHTLEWGYSMTAALAIACSTQATTEHGLRDVHLTVEQHVMQWIWMEGTHVQAAGSFRLAE